MAIDSYIALPPDSSGKKLFMQQHTVANTTVQTQVVHIGSHENPEYIQHVDKRGQASVRFAEGSPSVSPMNRMRVANAKILGGYEYSHDSQEALFQDKVLNSGTVTWEAQSARTILATSAANNSTAIRTTNRYHFYQPGNGMYIPITLSLDDNGKINNTRRWGIFDDENGVFFELQDTTLNVVIRSNTTGPVTEQRIPRSQWEDKLDGTGISGINIDLTKANFFWIDYAWLGVGIARLGVVAADGSRWVAHEFQNPNANIHPYMATGSLPLRWENVNTGATSGASAINSICAAVYAEQRTDYVYWRFADIETPNPVTITSNTHIISMRPKLTNPSGDENRTGIYPETLNVYVSGGDAKITILDDATLLANNWIDATSLAQYSLQGTPINGTKFLSFYLSPGSHNINLAQYYESNDEGYHVLADATDSYNFVLLGTRLSNNNTTVMTTLGYRELN